VLGAPLPDPGGGGGATRPLPRDGGVEKLHGDPTVGPRPKVWTKVQKWTSRNERADSLAKTGATLPVTHVPCPLAPTIAKIRYTRYFL